MAPGRQDQEFLATEPADDVGLADGFQQDLAEFAQHGVARLVAIGVVDPFEVIHVENGDRHRLAAAGGTAGLACQRVLEEAAVVKPA